MPTGDNSQSRLTQRRRDVTLANYRIYNPTSPLQTPTMGGVTPVSVYVNSEKGILPWVYETPGGVVSEPNPVALPPVAAGPSGTAPGPPTLTSATPGDQRITLVWTAPSSIGSSPITDYLYTTDTGATKTYRSLATTGTTATITTNSAGTALANGTSYTISIVAVNTAGPSVASGSLSVTPVGPAMVITYNQAANGLTVSLGLVSGQSVTIDWGDSTSNIYNGPSSSQTRNYTSITTSRTLTITGRATAAGAIVSGGRGSIIYEGGGPAAITSVSAFLDSLTNLTYMFYGQQLNFTVPPNLPPDVTNLSQMFQNAIAFNQDINSWNTSKVTNMTAMFRGARSFNQPLARSGNSWNTAAVTNMANMFNGATAFYQDISSWNISSLTLNGAKSIFANCPLMIANTAYWPNFASNPLLAGQPSTWYTT